MAGLLLAGLAGAAKGAGGIAQQYIDQDFEQKRQENIARLQNGSWRERYDVQRQDQIQDNEAAAQAGAQKYQTERADKMADDELKFARDKELARYKDGGDSANNDKEWRKARQEIEKLRIEGSFSKPNEDGEMIFDSDEFNSAVARIDSIYGKQQMSQGIVDPFAGSTQDTPQDPRQNKFNEQDKKRQEEQAAARDELARAGIDIDKANENPLASAANSVGGLISKGFKHVADASNKVDEGSAVTMWKNGKRNGAVAKKIINSTSPDITQEDKHIAELIIKALGE